MAKKATTKGDTITLSNGEKATITAGDESWLTNAYVVRLKNDELRVVDRATLTLASLDK